MARISDSGQNPAQPLHWAGLFVEPLALLGRIAAALFYPQLRIGRAAFARGLLLWLLAGTAGYLLMDPIADAQWISDAALTHIARAYGWAYGLLSAGVTVLAARRVHDWGLAGAWALLLSAPGLNMLFLAACLFIPGREAGRAWPKAGEDGAVV